MTEMNMKITDRLMLLDVLPKTGDYLTIKILKEFKESVSFSEDELKHYELKFENGTVSWNTNHTEETKTLNISDPIKHIIKQAFKKLDEESMLREEHLELYEKFI